MKILSCNKAAASLISTKPLLAKNPRNFFFFFFLGPCPGVRGGGEGRGLGGKGGAQKGKIIYLHFIRREKKKNARILN